MNISLGSDHAGFIYKETIKKYLESLGYTVQDHGAYSLESMDYPESAHPVCRDVSCGDSRFGILLCGTANGMAMTANKYPSIRAGLAWNSEIAGLAREHNNANILCIPARYVTESEALDIINVFLQTDFAGGSHERRIEKMSFNIV